jgi:WD40 repeat protein
VKPNPFLKALSILLVLVFLVIGVVTLANPSTPSAVFVTSYQDFPEPKPVPQSDPSVVVEVSGLIRTFDISLDGSLIAIATSKNLILYQLKTLKEIHSLSLKEEVYQIQFSPDGSKLAVSGIIPKYSQSGSLHVTVWDTASWEVLYEYKSDTQDFFSIAALAWDPEGKRIAFSLHERGLSVIDVETGNVTASMKDFIISPFDLSWSPDGSRLISTGDLGYGLRRWKVDANQWVRLFDARSQPAQQVKWSPDGKQIASGHFGGTVCVWNTGNNQCEGFIRAHFISVDALDWSPDSRQIATASGAIRVWDSHTGELTSAFGFYDGIIYQDLRWFDPQTIATLETSYTQNLPSTIRFWDAATGDVKLVFRGWDNVQGINNGGVMLHLDDIQIGADRTVFQVSLRFDTPGLFTADMWHLTMTDSEGRIYPLTDITPQTMDAGVTRVYQTVPLQVGEYISLDMVSFPQQGRMPLMLDFSGNPASFNFDPGVLKIGESISLDEEIQANSYLLHLTGIQKTTANELLFEFDTQGVLSGAILSSPMAGASSSDLVNNDKFIVSLSFSDMPREPIAIEISRIYYNAFGPWLLEFQTAKSMFADLPVAAPAPVPTVQTETTFTSQDPLFLEVQALSNKLDNAILRGAGWVRVTSEVVMENIQQGQTYPPPYYQEEQWFEIDSQSWVTRNLTTHQDKNGVVIQQNISVGTHSMNLTIGEAMEFPTYRLSLDWILRDLDYALNHGQNVSRAEITCDDGSPCLLIKLDDGVILRRAWINLISGQQVKLQTSQQMPDGTEIVQFTQTFLPVERVDDAPQDILDVFSRVQLSAP